MEELLKVKVLKGQFSFLGNHINKGDILTVREIVTGYEVLYVSKQLRKTIGYQVVTGKHTGKIIEPEKVIVLSKGKTVPITEYVEMEQEYLRIIKKLKQDINDLNMICATQGTNMEMNEFLLATTAKALNRIVELKQEKETQNG